MKRSQRTNWTQVEADYVAGIQGPNGHYFPSLSELATQYGVHKDTIEGHCRRKGWVKQREAHQEALAATIREERKKKYLDDLERFDQHMLKLLKGASALALAALWKREQDPSGKMIETPNFDIPPRDYKRVVDSFPILMDLRGRVKEVLEVGKSDAFDDLLQVVKRQRTALNLPTEPGDEARKESRPMV